MHYNILLDLVCKITTAQRGCWHGGPAVSGFCPDNLVILRKSVNDVGFRVDNLVMENMAMMQRIFDVLLFRDASIHFKDDRTSKSKV